MAERRRALLLINRSSRSGAEAAERAVAELAASGLRLDRQHSGDRQHSQRLILALRNEIDLVIVGGGDGSINAVAPALVETGLPLAIIPLGTGNDLARTVGLPLDPVAAARLIATGSLRRIDVGTANGQPFFNAATIGLSNHAAQRLTGEIKRRWGPLGYPLTLIDAWRATHPFDVRIEADGQPERRRSVQIVVGNGRHHGAGMTVAASAQIDDRQLDLYSLDPQSWWRALGHLRALRSGTDRPAPGLWRVTARRAVVETDRPMRVRTDGEATTTTPTTFEILPGAVSVVVGRSGD